MVAKYCNVANNIPLMAPSAAITSKTTTATSHLSRALLSSFFISAVSCSTFVASIASLILAIFSKVNSVGKRFSMSSRQLLSGYKAFSTCSSNSDMLTLVLLGSCAVSKYWIYLSLTGSGRSDSNSLTRLTWAFDIAFCVFCCFSCRFRLCGNTIKYSTSRSPKPAKNPANAPISKFGMGGVGNFGVDNQVAMPMRITPIDPIAILTLVDNPGTLNDFAALPPMMAIKRVTPPIMATMASEVIFSSSTWVLYLHSIRPFLSMFSIKTYAIICPVTDKLQSSDSNRPPLLKSPPKLTDFNSVRFGGFC